jgi:hypothetical protein
MKTKLFLTALLLISPAFAADAPADAAKPANTSVCLRHSDVDGWGARDRKSMIVNDRFGKKFLVSLSGLCDDINYAFGAGFRPIGGGPNFGTCVDRGDRLVMRGGGVTPGNNTCWVTKVQPYTKDMEAADKLARENKQPLQAY